MPARWGAVAKLGVGRREAKRWPCASEEVYVEKSGLGKNGDGGALDAGVQGLEKAEVEETGEEGNRSLKGL